MASTRKNSSFTVTVAVDQDTAERLTEGGYHLYGFKAAESTGDGAPLVWFDRPGGFAAQIKISWTERYQAYASTGRLAEDGQIAKINAQAVELGQTLLITDPSGTGEVAESGAPGRITIRNETAKPLTTGISQQQAVMSQDLTSPLCAAVTPGGGEAVFTPVERIFLTFAAAGRHPGTVTAQAFSPGLVIDLTGAQSRSVGYDIDDGWTWKGSADWAWEILADENLAEQLVNPSAVPREAAMSGRRAR